MSLYDYDQILIIHGIATDVDTVAIEEKAWSSLNVNPELVTAIDYEEIFDRSKLSWVNKMIVKLGIAAIKAKFGYVVGAIGGGLVEDKVNKYEDIWLALNPVFTRSRKEAIEKIKTRILKYENPLVIGHSMGSVLSRKAIEELCDEDRLLVPPKLVTIGSPLWMDMVGKLVGLSNDYSFDCDWINIHSRVTKDPIAAEPIAEEFGIELEDQYDANCTHKIEGYLIYLRKLIEQGALHTPI